MEFRKMMEDADFAFEFATEDGSLLFTAYGKSEDNDGCYLIAAPLYENPKNLAMYYIEDMEDVLRFMKDVYELSEGDLDEAIAGAKSEDKSEEHEEALSPADEHAFVPGQMDEEAEFGGK